MTTLERIALYPAPEVHALPIARRPHLLAHRAGPRHTWICPALAMRSRPSLGPNGVGGAWLCPAITKQTHFPSGRAPGGRGRTLGGRRRCPAKTQRTRLARRRSNTIRCSNLSDITKQTHFLLSRARARRAWRCPAFSHRTHFVLSRAAARRAGRSSGSARRISVALGPFARTCASRALDCRPAELGYNCRMLSANQVCPNHISRGEEWIRDRG